MHFVAKASHLQYSFTYVLWQATDNYIYQIWVNFWMTLEIILDSDTLIQVWLHIANCINNILCLQSL